MLIHPKWFNFLQINQPMDRECVYDMALGRESVLLSPYVELTDLEDYGEVILDIKEGFVTKYLKYWGKGLFLPPVMIPYNNTAGYLFKYPCGVSRHGSEIRIESNPTTGRSITRVPLVRGNRYPLERVDKVLIDYFCGVLPQKREFKRDVGIEGFFKGVASLELSSPVSLKLIEGYCKKNNVEYSQMEKLMGLLEKTGGNDENNADMA